MKVELAGKKVSHLEKCSILKTEQIEIAILPARTRGLGQLGGIVGSFLRYGLFSCKFESV